MSEDAVRKRILVVEDQAFIRELVSESLWEAGFEVVEADTGDKAALILLAPDRVDLLLTDIQMPGHLDGNALAAAARKQRPMLPVIFMTGRPDSLRSKLGARDAFVSKPFIIREVLSLVRQLSAA